MQYKGIILDFNGTLVWDTPLHKEAWLLFSRELGVDLSVQRYYNEVHGKTTKNILEHLLGRDIEEAELQQMSDHKEELYRQACISNPEIYCFAPGVEVFLDFISDSGIPRTIATASEKPNLDFFIESLGLERWFDTGAFVYDDGQVANKPEPDIYLKAAGKLGMPISDIVVVEDSIYGAIAAERAGAGYLIVTGPEEDRHEDMNSLEGVNLFISDFAGIDRNLFYA